jgi:hypothetical protein
MLASFLIAASMMMVAVLAASQRRVPPPGILIPDETRKDLEAGAQSLAREIDSLRLALNGKPDQLELLPDIQIFHKAVDWALRYDEFYRTNEVQIARVLLLQGKERAAWLRNGEAPWASMTGLVVRGYVSSIDGSVQPYGLVVPASFARKPATLSKIEPPSEHRLDIWLHGRDDHLTELKFINDRQRSYGEFAPTNAFVLHPYGRYCNAFKVAGEMDVFEALDHVKKHYPIDENRVALRGFSMGGAGCWHLGAHHAGQWAVVTPGAGFANTADYLKLRRGQGGPPGYEQRLWHLYDSTDYALNLFNTEVIAYSGEIDKQKAAADAMAAALKANGMELVHLIGPGTEHKYEPETKKELAKRVDELVARGRNPVPRRIQFTTWSLRYNEMSWLALEGLEKHWDRARIEAEILNPHEVKIRAENVTGLTLAMPAGCCPLDVTLRPGIQVNGQMLEAPRVQMDGSWKVRLMERSGRWSVVHSFEDGRLRKRHGLQGPIDDAFMGSFMMVAPSGQAWNESIGHWTTNELAKAVAQWRDQFRGEARVKRDDQVTDADAAANHLILWGDPQSNKLIGRIARRLPIVWHEKVLQVGKESFDSAHHLAVLIYPNPMNSERYVVLNSGFTFAHPRSPSNADQTPKLPDYAVIDIDGPPTIGAYGEVVEAGFFDEQWKLPKQSK